MFFSNNLMLDDFGDVLMNFNIMIGDLFFNYVMIFMVILVMIDVFLYFDFL